MEENKKETPGEANVVQEKAKKQATKNSLWIALIVLVLVIGGLYFGLRRVEGGAAATVNGEEISRAEYNERVAQIESQYGAQLEMSGQEALLEDKEVQAQIKNVAMDELIDERLFLQAAAGAGIEISETAVEEELDSQKSSYPDEAAFQSDLAAFGITEEELKESIKKQLTILAYARSVVPESEYAVTDEELEELYTLNYGSILESGAEGIEGLVPSLEEFTENYREQFEIQKLGIAVGPHIEGLRSNATIDIHINLPEVVEVPPEALPQGEESAGGDAEASGEQVESTEGEAQSEE